MPTKCYDTIPVDSPLFNTINRIDDKLEQLSSILSVVTKRSNATPGNLNDQDYDTLLNERLLGIDRKITIMLDNISL